MPFDPARIRAICFDVDGTLSDTDDLMVSRIAQRLARIRRLLPARDPRRAARRVVMAIESPGNAILTLSDGLHLNRSLDWLTDRLYRGRLGRNPETYWIINGVQRTISRLARRYPLAIVSANHTAHVDGFLHQYNLQDYFTTIVTAHTCEHTKPFPHPMWYGARQLGVPADACLMVGDTTVDIRTGKAAGAQTIGVLCGFGRETELHRAGADLILPVTTHLADILLAPE